MTRKQISPQELAHLLAAQPVATAPQTTAAESPIIRHLRHLEQSVLAENIVEEEYAKRDIVFLEGAYGDAVYLVYSGRVAVVKGELASPTIILYRGAGEVVGEMSLLEDKPRIASVIAIEDSRLLRFTREGFKFILENEPAIGMEILESMSARLRVAHSISQVNTQIGRELSVQVDTLEHEKQQLLQLQQVRQETSDLIIHDLRNPLGTMQAALQMLNSVLPDEILDENAELFSIITAALTRMQMLVDSLLDVAQMESGEVQLNLTAVSINSLIHEALDTVMLAIQKRKTQLTIKLAEELPSLQLDPARIQRVLINLLDNALKFMPDPGHLKVYSRVEKDQVVVIVEDNGPGIPTDQRERIFERFTHVDSTLTRPRGFGLGLAFCKLAVEAHNGRIWVEPVTADQGSRFIFTLPIPYEAKA